MIPARAARSQTRGRPPFADRDVDGNKGSITAQRPSETSMADINRYSNRTNPPASGFETPSYERDTSGSRETQGLQVPGLWLNSFLGRVRMGIQTV